MINLQNKSNFVLRMVVSLESVKSITYLFVLNVKFYVNCIQLFCAADAVNRFDVHACQYNTEEFFCQPLRETKFSEMESLLQIGIKY